MTDSKGNKAIVYPDGTFKEIGSYTPPAQEESKGTKYMKSMEKEGE
jgi:hypothetical protein